MTLRTGDLMSPCCWCHDHCHSVVSCQQFPEIETALERRDVGLMKQCKVQVRVSTNGKCYLDSLFYLNVVF